jgi:hypothetical protein
VTDAERATKGDSRTDASSPSPIILVPQNSKPAGSVLRAIPGELHIDLTDE